MKITSAEANKMLRNLEEEKKALLKIENDTKVTRYGEKDENVPESDYDFVKTQERRTAIDEQICKIKHELNKFNVRTELPGLGFTVDEALVRLPMLTAKKSQYNDMRTMQKLSRKMQGYSGAAEMIRRNFDVELVEKEYAAVCQQITDIQLALDKVNLTKCFNLEL